MGEVIFMLFVFVFVFVATKHSKTVYKTPDGCALLVVVGLMTQDQRLSLEAPSISQEPS